MEFRTIHDKMEMIDAIREKVKSLRNYTPKVGVFGNSGVGKSSLCNALFGKDVAKIADVQACTREPQEILVGSDNGKGGIILVDVPGIGEDPAHQREYTDLYKSLAPELDLVLWAIKADDRNYASAIDAYVEVFKGEDSVPVVFVITQIDKTNPIRDWDINLCGPGKIQQKNIAEKENDVSRRFDVSARRIISVSADESYNLKELVSLIVEVLPNEKKYAFTREAKEENVTEDAKEEAEKGIWETVKRFAGNAWDAVKDDVVNVLAESASKIAKSIFRWARGWF